MKVARVTGLFALTAAIAAGCGSGGGVDVDSGTDSGTDSGGSGTDSGTGASATDSGTDSGAGGLGSGAGGSGNGGLGGAAGAGTGGLPMGISFEYDPSKDSEVETCAATQIDSQEVFLDMFVMLDRSGSMTQPFGDNDSDGYCAIGDVNNGSRWCNSINALYDFFSDPTSVNMGFAYGEFRGGDNGCGPVELDVPFGLIEAGDANGQLANLVTELNNDNPDGGTPTERAVEALILETGDHVPTGTRRTIGILITDGVPTSCTNGNSAFEEMQELNALLVDHYEDNGIPTFVIGMDGVDEDNLEALAVGAGAAIHAEHCIPGDTDCSYYSVGDADPAVFMAALASIRESVLGCEYTVPSADVGVENLATLEVQFTPEVGEDPVTLTRVEDEAACAGDEEYWVDFPAGEDPIIKLCPDTCDTRGNGASVDISLKCEGS